MIRGKRVLLRAVEATDIERLAGWLNDPEISHLVGGFHLPISLSEQRDWYERAKADKRTVRLMIDDLETNEPIGMTGLWEIDWVNRHALTAIKFGPTNARGKGYGFDAIMTLMAYAFFQLGLNRLRGDILPYNIGSYRVYVEKCGWKLEGIARQDAFRDGIFQDRLLVACLKSDFTSLESAREYIPMPDQERVTILNTHRATTALS